MDFHLIGQLIRLRYKLLWAKTRTRNGKIALFMAGYLLLVPAIFLFAAVGAGGGMAAVRSGKAERIAQGALTGLFACATVISVMLGFGLNEVFSDAELRRYPLNARERLFARHFTGIADPFWFLFLALDLGMAFGLYLLGPGNLLLGTVAVLLLFVCNYFAARLVGLALDRIMRKKAGSVLLPIVFMLFCFLPGMAMPMLKKQPAAGGVILRILSFTPSFGAGSLMVRTDAHAFYGFALIVCWLLGLAAAVAAIERRPVKAARTVRAKAPARTVQAKEIRWDSRFGQASARFGSRYGPLVEHWLRFYFRCRRFKLSYLMSLPLMPFLLLFWSRQMGRGGDPFAAAVGVFAFSGLASTGAFVVNQYGYVGSGFRRYFLFPIDPADTLRASSYTLMALSSVYVVLAALAWALFAPVPSGARGMTMLVASGVFGLFASHGAGLWTTLYGPRRSDPNKIMGNDLSLAGNLVVTGGIMLMLFVPMIVGQVNKHILSPDHWWVVVILAALAACFYFASLQRASAILPARRERILAVVEGRA